MMRPSRASVYSAMQKNRVSQYGQSSIEYAVVCAALAFALGIGMIDEDSVLRQLIEAFQIAYQRFSYALSLPT